MRGFPSHTSLSPLQLQRLSANPTSLLMSSDYPSHDQQRETSSRNLTRGSIPNLPYGGSVLLGGSVNHNPFDHSYSSEHNHYSWPSQPTSYTPPNIHIQTTAHHLPYPSGPQVASAQIYSQPTWSQQFPPTSYGDGPQYFDPRSMDYTPSPSLDIASFPSPTYSTDRLSPVGGNHTPTSPQSPSSQGLSDIGTPSSQNFQMPLTDPSRPQYTIQQQLQFFRDATALLSVTATGPFVPQPMYKPHTNSDRRRYVEEVTLEAPIYFWAVNPGECGIPLVDALHSRVRRLQGRDETVFEGRGPSVSIRLEWPGYRQWSRQIPTKDFRSPPGPITRAKLAKNVAKCVQRFISERQNHILEDDGDSRWRVGNAPNEIKLEDLVLVSIHHVSMGSWQPQLRLRRPLH